MVKVTCSASAAQSFTSLDPGHQPTHRSSSHAEVTSHIEELEGHTTIYWGFGEEKKKKEEGWQRMSAQGESFPA